MGHAIAHWLLLAETSSAFAVAISGVLGRDAASMVEGSQPRCYRRSQDSDWHRALVLAVSRRTPANPL
ncbi:hypothetical protein MTO96_007400 [Rhipicephalus appendiculatus]